MVIRVSVCVTCTLNRMIKEELVTQKENQQQLAKMKKQVKSY
jgi:sulfur relay (sulfurtransferase) complex TusBCD TusD component (DsrE family)